MKYSFIIPVYNCKAYLPACVESIRAAGMADYEILLVDDGSTDGSGATCDKLAGKYAQIRVIHKENGGVSSARNRGIEEAEGEKILFVDSDDTLDPEKLAALVEDFPATGADMAIFGISFDYYKDQRYYRSDAMYFNYDGIMYSWQWKHRFRELFGINAISSSCTKVFQRSILMEHHIRFNERMFLYEDLEFVLRYMVHCETIFNVPQAVYHYRQSEDEGNAKRRLARIDCLSDFMVPIETAVNALPGVPAEQKEAVLVQLYQVLVREKIAVSDMKQVGAICDDYAQWYTARGYTDGDNGFHRNLLNRKVLKLMIRDRKSVLRHRVAVWAKANHLYKRK